MNTTAEITDAEIISNILNGEKEKFALLIRRYNQRLYRICKSYIRDENEAEDIMQETYIRGYLNLTAFEGRAQFSTWLTRILINECLRRLKSMERRNSTIIAGSPREDFPRPDKKTPESESVQKEMRLLLEKSVLELPELYRTVFIMREIEKLSVAETSGSLMISEANVKVRLNRAKDLLKRTLLENFPLDELYEFEATRCLKVAAFVLQRI